jgi:hypothetical protein
MIDDTMSSTDHHPNSSSSSNSKLEQAFDIFDFTKTSPTTATSGSSSGTVDGAGGGGDNNNNSRNCSDAFDMGQNGTDPWSDETWGRGSLLIATNTAAAAADGETVETEDVFEFSTTDNDDNHIADSLLLEGLLVEGEQHLDNDDNNNNNEEQEEASRLFFPSADDFFREVSHEDPATVHVAMHEQLSAIYDDISDDPACQVEGSIHVKPSPELANSPFSLVLRDLMGHLKSVKQHRVGGGGHGTGDSSLSYCQDVTDKVSRQGLHKSDRVFRVMLPPNVLSNGEVPIAQYICSSRVRPVPLVRKMMMLRTLIAMVISTFFVSHFSQLTHFLSFVYSIFEVDQEPSPSFHQV